MNIIDYLRKNTNKEINANIVNKIMQLAYICEDKIGEGFFGKVYTPLISSIATVVVSDKLTLRFPIVVKESKHTEGKFHIYNSKKRMYLYSDRDLTAESLILFFISKFWYDTIFPYGPFLVSIHWCNNNQNVLIDRLVTQRHGYMETVVTDHKGIQFVGTYHKSFNKLETIGTLFEAGFNKCDSDYNFTLDLYETKLKFNIVELVNYVILHFLVAVDYCDNKGLVLTDQHLDNIFISWISVDMIHVGSKYMRDVTDIYYKLGDGLVIKAPLRDILIKLGDIGSSVLKLKKDLWILGDVISEDDIASHVEKYFEQYVPSYMTALSGLRDILPHKVFNDSILNDIYTDKHISKYTHSTGYVEPHKFPTANDILRKYFTQYIVKNYPTDSNSVFLIK